MLVRLTKCTVKGHSAPKMKKKNSQDDKYGSYMCAKGTQKPVFLPLFDYFSKWITLGTLEKSSNMAKFWFRK